MVFLVCIILAWIAMVCNLNGLSERSVDWFARKSGPSLLELLGVGAWEGQGCVAYAANATKAEAGTGDKGLFGALEIFPAKWGALDGQADFFCEFQGQIEADSVENKFLWWDNQQVSS